MAKVKVEQGTLVGGKTATENGFQFYEFLKIPYAKPPVGDLRFKSPQDPEPWNGERDATLDDVNCECLHFNFIEQKVTGLEDCLYLNVFTPKLTGKKPLPVMVYIHGGGFNLGSGVPKHLNGPDYLIEHNVVGVSINYRLGALGFLCLDIPEAAGNMGLKDQVMALKWIQRNITQFGGDRNNITIFGVSAGGASVEYLCISELSRGLFHKAIPQSGSPLNHWAISFKIKELSYKLAETLGCQAEDEKSVLDFLVAVPAQNLVAVSLSIVNFLASRPTTFGFVPTVEKDFGNGDAFITDNPYNIIKQNKDHDIPILKGFCEFEGLMCHLLKPKLVDELMEKRNIVEFCNHEIDDPAQFREKFSKVYFDEYIAKYEDMPTQSAINFLGDMDFSSGVWISSQLMTQHESPVYVYMYAYTLTFNMMDAMLKKDEQSQLKAINTPVKKRGAGHGEDGLFTMKVQGMDSSKYSKSDNLLIKRHSILWTNFAKTGNPTPTTSDDIPMKWPKFGGPEWKYLRIDKDLTIESDYNPSGMRVFKEMYEKYRR